MPQSKSKYEFWQQASLSQKTSNAIPILRYLAGTDREISDSIGILMYIDNPENMKLLAEDSLKWTIGLLNVLRLSSFATSEKTNEISKMGFMLPKGPSDVDMSDAHE